MSQPRKRPTPNWSSCSVLHKNAGHAQLWRFSLTNNQATLQETLQNEAAQTPSARSWKHLFQPQLNIAWLPADHVFLRVIHLPPGETDELPGMIELQLEKWSPIPISQLTWNFEVIREDDNGERTIALILAPINSVEEHLAQLEQTGFPADRLEIPLLHQVAVDPPANTLTRLYLDSTPDQTLALVAWWQNGRLESLNLLKFPNTTAGRESLVQQLNQLSWAGEIQGWLQQSPAWEIISQNETHNELSSSLSSWSGQPCSSRNAPTNTDLAQLAAQRSAKRPFPTNLVPNEFTARYQQQFVDHLWLRGLAVAFVFYILAVIGYAASTQYYSYRASQMKQMATQLAPAYTNAINLRYRLQIVQEQAGLQYAAIDCLLAVSERLPGALSLESFNFQGGSRLFLSGMVSGDDQARVTEFNSDLRKAVVDGQTLFEEGGVEAPTTTPRGRDLYRWSFTAKLNSPWLE
ncbi:MAG: hypothetical protein RI897_3910 [Verrucomicrobiota bacterium]